MSTASTRPPVASVTPGEQPASDDVLRDALASAILGATGDAPPTAPADARDYLTLLHRCQVAEHVTHGLLQQAVDAARAAGHSWAAVGTELGMSRQAAQQRFGGTPAATAPEERWLGPVTAFDEMDELALAGRLGWHTVEAGILRHRMVRTDTQWQHRRILWPHSPKSAVADGWQIGCRAFPWIYLIRDTGVPAEAEIGGTDADSAVAAGLAADSGPRSEPVPDSTELAPDAARRAGGD